ncbi:hypothetical protein LOF27_07685 [Xanthomonas euvesicatoria]|nr:hypothetical protein [Xanthomonas euvesicatoria]
MGPHLKWLDVVALFDRLPHEQDPTTRLLHVRYFTAPALGRFATHKQASETQATYLRALAHTHQQRFTTTLGKHSWEKGGTLLPEFVSGQPYDRARRVRVWKLEEKQTDVNLALAMYRDAAVVFRLLSFSEGECTKFQEWASRNQILRARMEGSTMDHG